MFEVHLYLDTLPLRYLLLFGGGGGQQGGGTTTTNTTNTMLPWSGQVPGYTQKAYKQLMPQLQSRANAGLTPQEQAHFTGQGMSDVAASTGSAKKGLAGNLARSGARGGAVDEAYSDLARSKVMANAGVTSNIQGLDVTQKGANIDRLMKGIALPGSPITTGTQGVTNYMPKSSGGGGS